MVPEDLIERVIKHYRIGGTKSQTKLAMRTKPDKFKTRVIGFAVDQHQVGLDVTIAVIFPLTSQRVTDSSSRQWFIF